MRFTCSENDSHRRLGVPRFHCFRNNFSDSVQAQPAYVTNFRTSCRLFAVFAGLLTFAYPRSTAMVCLVVVGSAILLEAIQMLTPDRDARALDAIQKISGGTLGIIVVNVTRLWR
jgi:VanZ family protein